MPAYHEHGKARRIIVKKRKLKALIVDYVWWSRQDEIKGSKCPEDMAIIDKELARITKKIWNFVNNELYNL